MFKFKSRVKNCKDSNKLDYKLIADTYKTSYKHTTEHPESEEGNHHYLVVQSYFQTNVVLKLFPKIQDDFNFVTQFPFILSHPAKKNWTNKDNYLRQQMLSFI